MHILALLTRATSLLQLIVTHVNTPNLKKRESHTAYKPTPINGHPVFFSLIHLPPL